MNMKKYISILFLTLLIIGCSGEDDTSTTITSITISSNLETVNVGGQFIFSATSNLDNSITSDVTFYVNEIAIQNANYTTTQEGGLTVYAKLGNVISNTLQLNVTEAPITSTVLSTQNSTGFIGDNFELKTTSNTGIIITNDSDYYVDGVQISSNIFTPTATGEFLIVSKYSYEGELITSNELIITINPETTERTIFNEIVFYDGYAASTSDPVPPNVVKISNSRYVKKLTTQDLAAVSDNLEMEIIIHALCDNYDRIGSVYLNLVNKDEDFDENTVHTRQEIARFITPFMNKNISPDEVPYSFELNNIAKLLKNTSLNALYDFWIEFEVFGVPYAANTQVAGCQGRNDVFAGTLKLISTDENYTNNDQELISIFSKVSLNNYNATDVSGETIRINDFNVASPLTNAKLYIITSNHGANSGGEEYVRREHFIYFDSNLVSSYTPGGQSCEPFRQYNTQGNGIYGNAPQSDSWWASWNNWCPGDKIPVRIYDLGSLSAGNHQFKIDVPDAVFNDGEGDFPLTAYIQGNIQ